MKKILAIFLVLVCVALTAVLPAAAAESTLTAEQKDRNEEKVNLEKIRIYDGADLFGADDEATLEVIYYAYTINACADIILVTTDDMDGKSDQVYLEDFQDELYFEQDMLAENAALMLINMEERSVTIQGYGDCEFWLNNDRTEYILDWVYEDLADGDYFAAAETFAEQVVYYMNQDAGVSTEYEQGQDYGESYGGETNYYTETLREQYGVWEFVGERLQGKVIKSALMGIGVSLIVVVCIVANRRAKVTVNQNTYADMGNSGLTASRDDYLRTTVTKVRKPKESSGSSGGRSSGGRSSGGGGRSSGGRSHSGGSRRF